MQAQIDFRSNEDSDASRPGKRASFKLHRKQPVEIFLHKYHCWTQIFSKRVSVAYFWIVGMLTPAKFINLRVLTFGRRMFGTNLQHILHTYAIF